MPASALQGDFHVEPGTMVAVTGATGFIGGRLVERLMEEGAKVTCLLRGKPSARLKQTGATFQTLDLADEQALLDATRGMQWVFHLAYDWNDEEWNSKALRALMRASLSNSWQRLVHTSTFVVYDIPPSGELTEETIGTTANGGYGFMKREMDKELLKAVEERGVPATIVQPTIVYGPYSAPWTNDPAEMLLNGTVVLPERGEGICNAVYVDDVVNGMILAAKNPAAIGQRYLISGDPVTWGQFYEAIADAAGAQPPVYMPLDAIKQENKRIRRLVRQAKSPRLLAREIAQQRLLDKLIRKGTNFLPWRIRQPVNEQLFGSPNRQRGYVHMPDEGRVGFLEGRSTIVCGKARRELGYVPQFNLAAGMASTTDYLRNVFRKE